MKEIKITGKISVGGHNPVFMIAEVGSNWKTFDDCLHSIAMAKACGADAVKFQAFSRIALNGFYPHPAEQGEFREMEGELPIKWLPNLKLHADAIGIEFMCSAFSPELIDAVNPYVNVHKVASAEMNHKRMLEKLRKIGKPVILSTGASGDGDIGMALDCLGDTPTVLMYCISAYPARTTRLEHIDLLRSRFNHLVGFSDHSMDIFTIPAEAIFQHQACVLEKHVNFIDGVVSPDSPHSLTTDEYKLMVIRARNNLAIEARQSHEEKEMYTKHNRRLIATCDVRAGEDLRESVNFGIYRSIAQDTRGLHPFFIDQVNGKKATKEIKAGEAIGPGDFT